MDFEAKEAVNLSSVRSIWIIKNGKKMAKNENLFVSQEVYFKSSHNALKYLLNHSS